MNDFDPVKPARSFEEQFMRLTKTHGLTVRDVDEAKHIFSTVNYYRLSVYGKQLRRTDDPEMYREGVTLKQLYDLYRFDMGLRHALLPVLEFFEIQLRARLAYRHAIIYGSEGYTDPANFAYDDTGSTAAAHRNLMSKFRSEVHRQDDTAFVKHHMEKYGGHFPVWSAVELFTFGMLGELYSLMKPADRNAIANQYGMKSGTLDKLIDCCVEVRNICAHYNRLYNRVIESLPESDRSGPLTDDKRLFPLLLSLRGCLRKEGVWQEMLEALAVLQVRYPVADLALCGFPDNWQKALL